MKKRNYFILFVSVCLALTSCSKDESTELEKLKIQEKENVSVETNKKNLENYGIEMASEFEGLKENKSMDVMSSLFNLPAPFGKNVNVLIPLKLLSDIQNGTISSMELLFAIKNAGIDKTDIAQEWNELVGRYSWNLTTYNWDFTPLEDAIVIEFPGSINDNSNTAVITIDDFSFETVSPKYQPKPNEIPTSINMQLTYNTEELMSYLFAASYRSDGYPLNKKSICNFDTYSLVSDHNYIPEELMSVKRTFKNNDRVLLETYTEAGGNSFKIDVNILGVWENENEDDIRVQLNKLVSNSNTYLRIMDVKIVGSVDIKGILKGIGLNNLTNKDKDEVVSKTVAAINDNSELVVLDMETNEFIAKTELYVGENELGEAEVDARFVFTDGSKIDVEAYFNGILNEFEVEIKLLVEDLIENYGWILEEI